MKRYMVGWHTGEIFEKIKEGHLREISSGYITLWSREAEEDPLNQERIFDNYWEAWALSLKHKREWGNEVALGRWIW